MTKRYTEGTMTEGTKKRIMNKLKNHLKTINEFIEITTTHYDNDFLKSAYLHGVSTGIDYCKDSLFLFDTNCDTVDTLINQLVKYRDNVQYSIDHYEEQAYDMQWLKGHMESVQFCLNIINK